MASSRWWTGWRSRRAASPPTSRRWRAADNALEHDNPIEEVFEDQVACADLVVLNKRDLLDTAGIDRAMAAIAGVLPRAVKVLMASSGRVDPAALLGLALGSED